MASTFCLDGSPAIWWFHTSCTQVSLYPFNICNNPLWLLISFILTLLRIDDPQAFKTLVRLKSSESSDDALYEKVQKKKHNSFFAFVLFDNI